MARRTPKTIVDYIDAWRKLIDATPDPHTLLERWRAERTLRDDLKIPIAQRLDLLRLIAPEEGAS